MVHRRNLEAIHRRTLAFLRQQVRPCSPRTLQAFWLEHQHLAPGTRLLGEAALPTVVEQLAGRLVPVACDFKCAFDQDDENWKRLEMPAHLFAADFSDFEAPTSSALELSMDESRVEKAADAVLAMLAKNGEIDLDG